MRMAQTLSTTIETDSTGSAPAPLGRRRAVIISVVLFCLALFSLMVSSVKLGINPLGHSEANHFVYQAQSLLHGHLDIPHFAHEDIILVNGKFYIVYPPFPAILMMPFVAIFGLGFSDIFFTQVFSAINIVLLFWVLETLRLSGRSRRSFQQNFALSIFFFFGTISFYLSLGGTMWFTAHIVAATCTLCFMLFAFKKRYVLAALCLGCAFLTRAPAVVGLLLLCYLLLEERTGAATLRGILKGVRGLPWRKVSLALAPLVAAALLFLLRNTLAFGSPLQTGYPLLVQQLYPEVHYGVIGPHYIWPDFVANFLSFPTFTYRDAFDISPSVDLLNGGIGLSVFATTPLFLFLFFIRNRQPSALRKVLWMVVGLVIAATLIYHAAGWYQFGSRYLFEGYPYAFLLLALSEIEMDWRFYLLGLAGIVINFLGAQAFWLSLLAPPPHP
ncbi:MAG TPA: hypothetical protein VF099_10165 [Ktedonobacterales bacterium]